MKLLRRVLFAAIAWRLLAPALKPRFRPPQEHPWRLTGRTVFIGDEEFVVRDVGDGGAVPVLLIHGLAGSSLSEWYQIGQKLAAGRRVVMVDQRNHGLSPHGVDRYEIEDVADDYVAVLDALGIGQVDVVGYSMGGTIAQAMAHRHPGRVRRLVLVATFAAHVGALRRVRQIGAVLGRGWERLTGVGTPEVRFEYLVRTGAVSNEHARWLWEETHRRTPEGGAQATLAMLRFDSRPWLGRLELPVMVVIPGHDLLVPPAWQYEMASMAHAERVVELPEAGHEVVWTHPDRIVDELTSFLA
jgi:pimeloyl-ACP methyl ester carboxylesterase